MARPLAIAVKLYMGEPRAWPKRKLGREREQARAFILGDVALDERGLRVFLRDDKKPEMGACMLRPVLPQEDDLDRARGRRVGGEPQQQAVFHERRVETDKRVVGLRIDLAERLFGP